MRRFLLFALLLGILLIPAGVAVAMDVSEYVSFHWQVGDRTVPLYLTKASGASSALYLPGGMEGGKWTVALEKCESVTIGDRTFRDGEEADLTQWVGQTVDIALSTGRKESGVKIMRGSAIPSLFFTVAPADLKRIHTKKTQDVREPASVVIADGQGGLAYADAVKSLHMRGNSTLFGAKKPYQFKLEHGVSLFGMGKGKTWLLLANWYDISLVRNQVAMDLCNAAGLRGTPDSCQADVYFNGRYYGTYLLTEKIQLKEGRLDITDMEDALEALNGEMLEKVRLKTDSKHSTRVLRYFDVQEPNDLTGGFLLEIEKSLHFSQNKEDAGFITDGYMCVVIKEPSRVGPLAADYIASLVNDFHNAVLEKDGYSRKTGRYYTDYIDVRSFAMKIIVEELTANYDVRAASQFMYKDSDWKDEKLYAGPGWDYDLTCGNHEEGARNPERADFVYRRSSSKAHLYHWLLTHEDFRKETRRLLTEEFLPLVDVLLGRADPPEGSRLRSLAAYREEVRDSAAMNFTRWSPRVVQDITNESGRTFDDAQDFLLDWITRRSAMMGREWLVDDAP